MELSKSQKLAVETTGKNVCVPAGAGSGKTGVLVERFLHLVKKHGLSPANILAITFTEKAANEMKRRIVERLREENLEEARREVEKACIGTIHAFAARLLREHPFEAGVDPYFSILESAEAELLQEKILNETIEALATEPEVFNLLHVYGEERVHSGILDVYAASRNSETPFETLLRKRAAASREMLEAEIKQGLSKLEDAPRVENFSDIQNLKAAYADLRAAGKQKDAVRRVKNALEDLIRLHLEEKALPFREVFIRVALEFEKAYRAAKDADRALDFDDLQLFAVRLLGTEGAASRALRKIYREKFRQIMVDEFQDTNRLQDRLLELLRGESNLFVVGDLKQSIYAFRGTRVEIFLEKEKDFSASPAGIRIPLAENFRSDAGLIQFINSFFETLWREDAAAFEPLVPTCGEKGEGPCVDWISIPEKEGENSEDLRIREARALAQHISHLVKEKGFRYKEIACLFRATSDIHLYEYEFRRRDIPYFVVSSGGFYTQPEIRDVISFLSVLENSRRDIPLAALLRSPFFQVSDDALFWLARRAKSEKKETPFIQGVLAFESLAEIPDAEKKKLAFFVETLERFLKEKEKLRLSDLVEEILRVTGYDLYVLKLRQGDRSFANLKKLIEIARELESKETLHLGEFIRTVKGLETRDIRQSQAQIEAEDSEVVKLLTVHMAKGLEFPVVVIPDLGREKNSDKGAFSLSEEEGLGFKILNDLKGKWEEGLTFSRNKKRRDKIQSEESKRLLYVAMTRAQKRLVLSGPKKTADPKKESFDLLGTWAEWLDRILTAGVWKISKIEEKPEDPFPFERRKALAERKPIRRRLENLSSIPLREVPTGVDELLLNLAPAERKCFPRIDLPVSAFLLFARDPEEYFRVYEIGIPNSFSQGKAFELKNEEMDSAEELAAADFGTLVHQILEQILVRKLQGKGAENLISRFTQNLGEKTRQEILELTQRFMQSGEAREILNAKAFYPELPFSLRLPFGLIHGTMDLVYERAPGDWVILDYKTSEVTEENFTERGEAYRVQLELYALALAEILKVPPREGRIHFLKTGRTYSIYFEPEQFEKLSEKFSGMQKQILEFRQVKLRIPTGISPGKW